MNTLTIQIDGAGAATSMLQSLGEEVSQRKINAAVSMPIYDLTKAHLYNLANTRHRAGVALNFWKDAGDAVSISSSLDAAEGIELRIDKAGVAQRYYGGTIKAVNPTHFGHGRPDIPLLWIPVAPESEGKASGEFKNLIPIYNALTSKGVAVQHEKGRKTADEPVLFTLVPEVTQPADPSVLPTDDEYTVAISTAVDELLFTLADRKGSQS